MKRSAVLLLCLFLAACESDGGAAPDTVTGTDTVLGADTAPSGECPSDLWAAANTACSAASEGLTCTDTMDWCGRSIANNGCECRNGSWACWSAGMPLPDHAACQEEHGDMWFCSESGVCIEADGCLAEDCCVPGTSGDAYCQATYGACNSCVAGPTGGTCSTGACE